MPSQDEQDYQDYQDYLAYQQHLSKSAPPEEPGLRGGSVRGIMDLIRPGYSDGQVQGAVDAGTLGNVKGNNNAVDPLGRAVGKGAGTIAMGMGAGAPVAAVSSVPGRIAAQAAVSGAMGAAQKPEGEDGIAPRLQQGGLHALIGGGLQALGEGAGAALSWGSKRINDLRDIKSGEMATRAQGAIDDAAEKLTDTQIVPKADKLKELIKGEQYEVNPDIVESTFPRYAAKLRERIPTQNVPKTFSNEAGTFTADVAEPTASRVSLSGPAGRRLRQAADSAAGWSRKVGVGDADAVAKVADAERLGNVMRDQINANPEIESLNKGIEDTIGLRQALQSREVASPIETLTAKAGTSRGSIIDQVDHQAGTGLRDFGHDIEGARGLLLQKPDIAHPMSFIKEGGRLGARATAEGLSLADVLRQKLPAKETLIDIGAQAPWNK